VCRYYEEKGFTVICMSRLLNLLALGFTIAFSAFLLLFVKWSALKSQCIQEDTCDISEVVLALTLSSHQQIGRVWYFAKDLRQLRLPGNGCSPG